MNLPVALVCHPGNTMCHDSIFGRAAYFFFVISPLFDFYVYSRISSFKLFYMGLRSWVKRMFYP